MMLRRPIKTTWSSSCSDLDKMAPRDHHPPRAAPAQQHQQQTRPSSLLTRLSLSFSLDGRKNGDSVGKAVTASGGSAGAGGGGATPPVDRKSKLSTLSKLFRPWKWKRKKKSERIEKTAVGE